MTTVFLSGSRKISHINDMIRDRVRKMMDQEFTIVMGDANGADKAMQNYLADSGYRNVTVFCAGRKCRNNVGGWETMNVDVSPSLKGRDFYTAKDRVMAAKADYGFVLWDGKSAGSINNVLELVKRGKCVVIYLSAKQEFFTVKNPDGITSLLQFCDSSDYLSIARKTNLSQTMAEINGSTQGALNL